jgi:fatty-acyl-CoA synthase
VSDLIDILFTAYVAVLLLLVMPLLGLLLLLLPQGAAAHRLVRVLSRMVVRASGCRLRVLGGTPPPGAMFVSNHASYLDSVVLLAALPADYRFVANHGVLKVPVIGAAVRKGGHLTVDRGSREARVACARAMTTTLAGGRSLLVYPEGTRGGRPGLLPFKLGAFRAAVDADRPIVPVALEGTGRIMTPGRWLLRPGAITVTVHEPIAPVARGRDEMVRLRDLAREAIASTLGT